MIVPLALPLPLVLTLTFVGLVIWLVIVPLRFGEVGCWVDSPAAIAAIFPENPALLSENNAFEAPAPVP